MTDSRSSIHEPSASAAIVACGTFGLSCEAEVLQSLDLREPRVDQPTSSRAARRVRPISASSSAARYATGVCCSRSASAASARKRRRTVGSFSSTRAPRSALPSGGLRVAAGRSSLVLPQSRWRSVARRARAAASSSSARCARCWAAGRCTRQAAGSTIAARRTSSTRDQQLRAVTDRVPHGRARSDASMSQR